MHICFQCLKITTPLDLHKHEKNTKNPRTPCVQLMTDDVQQPGHCQLSPPSTM